MRAPFNVLVIPFRKSANGNYEFAVFKRADEGYWQFIAGGGEDDESPAEAAVRESNEEACIPSGTSFYSLKSVSSVPVIFFLAAKEIWPRDLYVIPNYSFAADCRNLDIIISHEHTEFKWAGYDECYEFLNWDNNKVALWELNERLRRDDLILMEKSELA